MTHKLFPEAVNFETAKIAEDYPYGFTLRTKMHYWVEFKKNYGFRVTNQTINPKNGQLNKPKSGTYSFLPVYIGENPENGYFEPVYVPHYLDEKLENFVHEYWNQIPENHQKLIKAYFTAILVRSADYYFQNGGYTLENLSERMGW